MIQTTIFKQQQPSNKQQANLIDNPQPLVENPQLKFNSSVLNNILQE